MSTSQALGVVGAAVGYWISGGNPQGAQWGYMIGPNIGLYVDPEVIRQQDEEVSE